MGNALLVGFEDLIEVIADRHHVTTDGIMGRDRSPTVARARAEVCHALYHLPGRGLSYPEIGRLIGGRDHTTIMAAVESHREWLFQRVALSPGELTSCEGSKRTRVAYHSPWLT